MVENPTDEDWSNVKMALISGRPISFKMDLYNPLYINRPVVEPELFASLRPVTYRGGFDQRQMVSVSVGLFDDSGRQNVPALGPLPLATYAPGAAASVPALPSPLPTSAPAAPPPSREMNLRF